MVTRIGPKQPHRSYIREWREKLGLTQDQLAGRLGTTKASISRWENKKRGPTLNVVAAIAEALDRPITDLFRHPDQPSVDELLRAEPQQRQNAAVEIVKAYLRGGA
jgi:transcriptional regulator with XRE-family HTH domain